MKKFQHFYNNFFALFNRKAELLREKRVTLINISFKYECMFDSLYGLPTLVQGVKFIFVQQAKNQTD